MNWIGQVKIPVCRADVFESWKGGAQNQSRPDSAASRWLPLTLHGRFSETQHAVNENKGKFLVDGKFSNEFIWISSHKSSFFHERNHRDQSGILCLIPFATGWAFPSFHFLLQSITNDDGKYREKELFGQRGVPPKRCPKENVFLFGK